MPRHGPRNSEFIRLLRGDLSCMSTHYEVHLVRSAVDLLQQTLEINRAAGAGRGDDEFHRRELNGNSPLRRAISLRNDDAVEALRRIHPAGLAAVVGPADGVAGAGDVGCNRLPRAVVGVGFPLDAVADAGLARPS